MLNDGIVKIYTATSIKTIAATPKETLRYQERTVGVQRYALNAQANVKVDYLLRCLRRRNVSTQDIAIPNDGKQYRIVQIQYPEDVLPPMMDLTLEGVKGAYDITDA